MLDRINEHILSILGEDARTPFLAMAKKLDLSESAVRKRVKSLEKEGVIQKYTALVEPSKVGISSVALVGIDVKPEKFLEVANRLTEYPRIKFVATTTGDHTIMTEIWMNNSQELRSFIKTEIESMDGVMRTCPAIITETLKRK